ncbi:NADPH--cytochrome P450 reductase [Gossypium arboreum]|uniref:NADPH--cytochrome P450 reductase n=1 Tax=Gossypium arboreum TaxID=29729 RepID=A0A0B0NM65_GOSAR|nr:NADPH--cytochrome P450 reductase [Gossypium arboreum]
MFERPRTNLRNGFTCKTTFGTLSSYLISCKTLSWTLALYELFELSAYPYDFELFNGHFKKGMNI